MKNKKLFILLGVLTMSLLVSFMVLTRLPSQKVISSLYPELSNEDLAKQADLIVAGEVMEKLPSKANKVFQNNNLVGEEIYTDFKFQVNKTLKGQSNEIISIRTDGGEVGNNKVIAMDEVKLDVKDKNVLLFLKNIDGSTYYILGGPQGYFKLKNNKAENEIPNRSMELVDLENLVAKNKI